MFKHRKVTILFLLLTASVNLIYFFRFVLYPANTKVVIADNLVELSPKITNENPLTQSFFGDNVLLKEIGIFFSTYNGTCEGDLEISIRDSSNEIYETKIKTSNLDDNQYHVISDINIYLKRNEPYTFVIHPLSEKGGVSGWRDQNGQIVSFYQYTPKYDLSNWICTNISFACINLLICRLLLFLR